MGIYLRDTSKCDRTLTKWVATWNIRLFFFFLFFKSIIRTENFLTRIYFLYIYLFINSWNFTYLEYEFTIIEHYLFLILNQFSRMEYLYFITKNWI